MNPRDALHQQEILLDSLFSHRHQGYLAGVMADIERKANGPVIHDDKGKIDGEVIAKTLAQLLTMAETFYVSTDMALVAEAASHGLDETDQFTHDMWPSDNGFLLFERGFEVQDVWGRPVITNALAWQRRSNQGQPGTMLWEFGMVGDDRDPLTLSMTPEQQQDLVNKLGTRLTLGHTAWLQDGYHVGPAVAPTPEKYQNPEYYDAEIESLMGDYRSQGPMPVAGNPGRVILALLMLMQQKIARKEPYDLKPRNPKRARRMKVPGQVTIIRLRQEASQREPGESHVEWQHRWFVRGHWRWQPCGADYPLAVEVSPGEYRARIFINPFVKGPEGAPLKQSKKVNALIR